MSKRTCSMCKAHIFPKKFGVVYKGKRKQYLCFGCCADVDRERMKNEGKATMYLQYVSPCHNPQFTSGGINLTASEYVVSNWTGSLTMVTTKVQVGRHNMTGRRWDVWFRMNDQKWWGVSYGNNTQLLHCKRIKG